MEAQPRKFNAVFTAKGFSPKTIDVFSHTLVEKVLVNSASQTLIVFLQSSKLICEQHTFDFERELTSAFPKLKAATVQIAYELPSNIAHDLRKTVDLAWNNVIDSVKRKSPLCAKVLADAADKLHIESNVLTLSTEYDAVFLLRSRNIGELVEDYFKTSFGTDIKVSFNVLKEKSSTKPSSVKSESAGANPRPIPQVPEKIQEQPRPQASASVPRKPQTSSGYGYGGGNMPRRMKKTKLVELIVGEAVPLNGDIRPETEIIIAGQITNVDTRETKSGKILTIFDVYDRTSTLTVKFFANPSEYEPFKKRIVKGDFVRVAGKAEFDTFSNEITLMAAEISLGEPFTIRKDNASKKRVELHLHTHMSSMDGMTAIEEYVERAASWGHSAIAVTDHGVLQAFPNAMNAAKKHGIKMIYGVECYLVDDLAAAVRQETGQSFDDTFVVFDLETTGLNPGSDSIIEFGALKIENGEITDRFSTFVNPSRKIPPRITELTGINDTMVADAPKIADAFADFKDFVGDAVLVAHNAEFDMGFVNATARRLGIQFSNIYLDTLKLSRMLLPSLSRHKLGVVAEYLGVSLENAHRAVDDAGATAEIFLKFLGMLRNQGCATLQDINEFANDKKHKIESRHAVILVKNQTGLRNLYELVSLAHLRYFRRTPRTPKSEFQRLREGLLIGTACESGELYKAVLNNAPDEHIEELANFYDYFEIQPIGNNKYLLANETLSSESQLEDINRKIVEYGKRFGKPVIAACDAHFLNPEDEVFRRIIMTGDGFKDADSQPPLYFRTTEEMLAEFSYLGEDTAYEVVVTNTRLINDMIGDVKPIPDGSFPPHIEGSEEELTRLTMERAHATYGTPLPPIIQSRLTRELDSIVKNGFAVMYIIAQKLVAKSEEDGYLVGSRGSVGSSFVATMAGITEVNPLPPHYLCSNCKFTDFDSEIVIPYAGGSGCDMPNRTCPDCSAQLTKDGHDIPFETFLGFDGDKEPDIDLNFSGEYQAKAHAYTEALFGSDNVFKAGTIGTLADKTAYGYVRNYMEDKSISARNAEINRLKLGCVGIKRTTGQHPGGLIVVPKGRSIYDFTPVQRPANDINSEVVTTHFDYNAISGNLMKLDILGHDVPTIIRMLHSLTGLDPREVDLGDADIMSLFTSTEKLGITEADIKCKTGSLGLPEFGTGFVRGMLLDTAPSSFADLVRISGLSHGTDVWLNNAQELVRAGTATLREVIPTRDDIMVYLIIKGVDRLAAFRIMESVRRGRGVDEDEADLMRDADIPEWYIESCRKIKYMFPKGHAVAYVMMTVRIGYYKIHHPLAFYAAIFSVKAEDFDYELCCKGRAPVLRMIKQIEEIPREKQTAKDKGLYSLLELVNEMYARGFEFAPLDLYRSDAKQFIPHEGMLLPPLCSVAGLGANVAANILEARSDGEFLTIENFRERTKVNKTVIQLLKDNGVLDGIPESNQMTLF